MSASKPKVAKFTQALFNGICERIADGKSLRAICADKDMPSKTAVMNWLGDDESGDFVDQYARAREAQADLLFDEILEIADDSGLDVSVDDKGKYTVDGENIQRARLRVDARKWMAGKMQPKKYGEKQDLNVTGDFNIMIGGKDADCL